MEGSLELLGPTGDLEPLKRLQPDMAERTLGVMMAPQDDGVAQLNALATKAKEWADNLRPQCLARSYDVIPLVNTTILKSLEFPSPLCSFSLHL